MLTAFLFAFPYAAFPLHEEGQPLQLYSISGLNTFTCVMAWLSFPPAPHLNSHQSTWSSVLSCWL